MVIGPEKVEVGVMKRLVDEGGNFVKPVNVVDNETKMTGYKKFQFI